MIWRHDTTVKKAGGIRQAGFGTIGTIGTPLNRNRENQLKPEHITVLEQSINNKYHPGMYSLYLWVCRFIPGFNIEVLCQLCQLCQNLLARLYAANLLCGKNLRIYLIIKPGSPAGCRLRLLFWPYQPG